MKTELKNLKKEMLHAQEEIKRIQSVPLVIGQFLEAVDQNTGIVGSTTGKSLDVYFTKSRRRLHYSISCLSFDLARVMFD